MKHNIKNKKLNKTSSHRKAMFMNMSNALIKHEQIKTTLAKAKELRRFVEKIITLGKKGDLLSKRKAISILQDQKMSKKVFDVLADRYKNRSGGYTRIIKIGDRFGDNAPTAVIEFVDRDENANLFNHIRYMTLTTVPSIVISLLFFILIGFFQVTTEDINNRFLFSSIEEKFFIHPILFVVPMVVIIMILKKIPPLIALMTGTILAALFALIFQQNIVLELTNSSKLTLNSAYKAIIDAITIETTIQSSNEILAELFKSGGMKGMLGTIWLIICAMVFGGVMDAIGALKKISEKLLEKAENTFQLIFSTSASCITVNLTASDQYLSIVVPGKMFQKAYQKRELASENLSRTLEDSGTVTSVLIPWNTCGAYQSSVLGVSVIDYFVYAIFNWISPFMTLSYAYFGIKIKKLID